ncbi:MAG: VWA domain-containing protein [Planctomycetota bacterium]
MTFATPLLAAIAAAVAIPALLILYFLKLRRRDVEVSSTLLWKQTIEDMQANAPFQRLRKNLLLFLQLLAVIAGLVALSQPELDATPVTGDRHTIMIDRSASMSAADGFWNGEPVTRLEQAKREALDFIDALAEPTWLDRLIDGDAAAGDRATVIAFDAAAEIRQVMTGNKAMLRSAIDSIEPTDAPTGAVQAFRLAEAQAERRTGTEDDGTTFDLPPVIGAVHLWTDGRIADAAEITPGPDDAVIYNRVGNPSPADRADNIGITGLRVERSFEDPRELAVFVGLGSTSPMERNADVELRIGGDIVSVRPATIAPATKTSLGTGGVVFTVERAAGATAEIRIRPTDSQADLLPADDIGFAVIPPAKRLAVAVVADDDFFTSLALEGLPLGSLVELSPEQFDEQRTSGQLGAYDVIVLDGVVPDGPLDPGSYLVLGGVPEGLGLAVTDRVPLDEVIDWDERHPVMRDLELGGRVTIADAPRVEIDAAAGVTVLAEAGVGPVIIDAATADARAIVAAFDPDRSSWPFDVSYVVFLAAAVEALGGVSSDAVDLVSAQPGGTIGTRLPPGAARVSLRADGIQRTSLTPAPDGRIAFGPVARAGLYTLEWSGQAAARDAVEGDRVRRSLAVNLLDPSETDIRPEPSLTFASGGVAAAETGSASAPRRLWPWLLAAALVIILFEWWVYNRKVYL